MEIATTHITYHIDTSQIYADEEFNCRGKIQPYNLTDLASSIKDHGLQIPVIIWEKDGLPNDCKFLLVAGYRRFFACTVILRQTQILATVRTDFTEQTARVLNFTENLERKNLNILEEARAIDISFPKRMSLREIGRLLNRGADWVKIRKLLLELSEEAQQAAAIGLFTISDIKLAHSTTPIHRPCLITQIIEARKEGRTIIRAPKSTAHRVLFLKPKPADIRSLILYLYEKGLTGLATRVLSYSIGRITLEELHMYIENIVKNRMEDHRIKAILDRKERANEARKHVPKRRRIGKSKVRRRH